MATSCGPQTTVCDPVCRTDIDPPVSELMELYDLANK